MELERKIDNPGISDGNTPIVTAAFLKWSEENGGYKLGIKVDDPKERDVKELSFLGTAEDRMHFVSVIEGYYGKLALSTDEGVKLIMGKYSEQIQPFFSEIASDLLEQEKAEREY